MTDEKYKEFVNIVCEMLGFNKPIDILKLCQKTSDFIRPYEMKIKDLEQVNEQLEIDNYNHRANLQRMTDMFEDLEQEKCELLGIIQQKDELIKKLICCQNCKKMGYNSSFAPICKVMNNSKIENPLGIKCDKWELAE